MLLWHADAAEMAKMLEPTLPGADSARGRVENQGRLERALGRDEHDVGRYAAVHGGLGEGVRRGLPGAVGCGRGQGAAGGPAGVGAQARGIENGDLATLKRAFIQ